MSFLKRTKFLFRARDSGMSAKADVKDRDGDSASEGEILVKDEDYPSWPPLPPQEILAQRDKYAAVVSARKFWCPRDQFTDSIVSAFYRLYEFIALDQVNGYRNHLEYIWRQHQWPVRDIPDPEDQDPFRYAFLACVTYLLVRSFNARIKLGLTRSAHPIMTMEEAEAAKQVPEEDRPYEKVPKWASEVSPLTDLLIVPTSDGTVLAGKHDKRADPDFLDKNILIWTPHIHFT
ncbi:hypothetical protein DV736_g2976, partial [Chaetothyriales sp. CBS 134916]